MSKKPQQYPMQHRPGIAADGAANRIAELRAENQNLRRLLAECGDVRRKQAELLIAAESGGKIVVTDDLPPDFNTDDIWMSSGAIQLHEQAAMQYAIDTMVPLEDAVNHLVGAVNQIAGYANCDNGPKTRAMVGRALDDLAAALQRLDTEQKRVNATGRIAVGIVDRSFFDFLGDMRSIATQYAANGTGFDQDALKGYILERFPDLEKKLYAAIENAKRRGRKKGQIDPVTRSATDSLDAARRELEIPSDRVLQYGEVDAIRRQAVHTLENTVGLTKADRDALDVLRRADRTYLSNLMNRDNSSPKLNSGDESGLDGI